MNELVIHTIELCSGVGMLGEGLRAGFAHMGIKTRTCVHVEREAYAASVLVARMEEGSLDAAPIWSDLCTFDATAWRGKVDCVVAGFPCQDLSVAGRRAGLDGKRSGLFFEVVRIAEGSGAWLIVLENVSGISSATATVMDEEEGELEERAAARVVGELADLGWNAEWIVISASDVGASHGRARWFCLAWRDVADAESRGRGQRIRDELARRAEAESAGEPMDDAARHGGDGLDREGGSRRGVCETGDTVGNATGINGDWSGASRDEARRAEPAIYGCSMADSSSAGLQIGIGGVKTMEHFNRPTGPSLGAFIEHSDSSLPALQMPGGETSSPSSPKSPRHLNPLFGAWLMGWPSTWVIAEPHALSALETELWRSRLQQRLSSLLAEPESLSEAA